MSLPEPYYADDAVTIYHADCADVLPHIGPASVDLVLTDPPYGIGHKAPNTGSGMARASRTAGQGVEGDDQPFDPARLLPFGSIILFGADRYSDQLPVGGWIVWDKTGGGNARTFMADGEMAWHNLSKSVDVFHHMWLGAFRASEHEARGLHPTQKPVSLMRWIVDRWTNHGDLVLDPYMGSGPVARACADLGRRYIGVEIVEDYCRVAVDRLRQQALDFGGAA